MLSLRSIDTYYFQVPDTGYNSGNGYAPAGSPALYTTGTGSGDVVINPDVTRPEVYNRDVTGPVRGPYQTETGSYSYKTIQYRPGH